MIRAVLDACVLYPTVLREVLLDVAAAGLYSPVWSDQILEEWRFAAARLGPDSDAIAGAEIALLQERFPAAKASSKGVAAIGLNLPDPDDRHVIETALNAEAGIIVTANLRDFPRQALGAVGLRARHPDEFLLELWAHHPEPVGQAVISAHAKSRALGGDMSLRELIKRARLPRLGRAMAR